VGPKLLENLSPLQCRQIRSKSESCGRNYLVGIHSLIHSSCVCFGSWFLPSLSLLLAGARSTNEWLKSARIFAQRQKCVLRRFMGANEQAAKGGGSFIYNLTRADDGDEIITASFRPFFLILTWFWKGKAWTETYRRI